jgi:predicted RNA-binding Zn-ribbon protein involved in translation (DUF1610 family)
MSDRVRAINCPSCGAPLEMPKEHQHLFKCNSCGTPLKDRSPSKEQKGSQNPNAVVHTISLSRSKTTQTPPITKSSKRAGWIILLLILGFAAASIIVPLWLTDEYECQFGGSLVDQIKRIRISSFGVTHLLPPDNDIEPDIIDVTYNFDETNRMVYVDFDTDPDLRLLKHIQNQQS